MEPDLMSYERKRILYDSVLFHHAVLATINLLIMVSSYEGKRLMPISHL